MSTITDKPSGFDQAAESLSDDAPERGTEAADRFRAGIALAVIGTFLFALKSIFIKLAFAAGGNPTLLLTIRMLFALPLYIAVLWRLQSSTQKVKLDRSVVIKTLALGSLGYYLASLLDLSGLQYISAQLERLTLFTYPAMVAVLAWLFLGESLGRRIIIAITLSYLGVMLMYGQERGLADGQNVGWGIGLVVLSALSYSFYILFAKPIMLRIGSRQFTSIAMIGSTGFVVVHFCLTQQLSNLVSASPAVYAYGLVIAFVCTVLPSFMINEAIVRIGATRTTVIGSVGPVLTMIIAILVLHEPSTVWHFVGMGIAILGVSLVAKRSD